MQRQPAGLASPSAAVAGFGALLRYLRRRARLTQHELALSVGYSRAQVSLLETGQRRPDVTAVAALFVPALNLESDPPLARWLLELAARARDGAENAAPLPPTGPAFMWETVPDVMAPGHPGRHGPPALPAPVLPILGREADLAALRARLCNPCVRLLTLLGPPGVGKTRLALELAWDLCGDFADGVCFVELASLVDASLVASAIVDVLGVSPAARGELPAALRAFVRGKTLLLVLDNFEQLLPAAPLVAELLAAAPALKILITSRQPLRLYGEHEFLLAPLAVPDLAHLLPIDDLSRNPAVALFVERAQAVHPAFALTQEHALAVAAVCARLDGLPLAIELAAAQVKYTAPAELAARLVNRLALAGRGARHAPARQQTLRGAIAWSYDLLAAEERRVFRQLGVFVDGFSPAAVAAVCQGDSLHALVDHSVIQRLPPGGGQERYGMLETLREFALEELGRSGEEAATRRRQADFYRELVEAAEQHYSTPAQPEWQAHLAVEQGNLREVLTWCRARDPVQGLIIAIALAPYWYSWGHYHEGISWLEQLLAPATAADASRVTQARALCAMGWLLHRMTRYDQARPYLEASLALYRELDATNMLPRLIQHLAENYHAAGNLEAAEALSLEALPLFRAHQDLVGVSWSLSSLAHIAYRQGQQTLAQTRIAECLHIARKITNPRHLGWMLGQSCAIYHAAGDLPRAQAHAAEGYEIFRRIDDRPGMAWTRVELGRMASAEGESLQAQRLYREALALTRESGTYVTLVLCLLGLLALQHGRHQRGVRLCAAAQAHDSYLWARLYSPEQQQWESALAEARATLGDVEYGRIWDEGQALRLEAVVDELTQ